MQWRLLLWWLILLALPTFVASLPMWQMLGDALDHSIYAPRLAEALDGLALADLISNVHEHHASALANLAEMQSERGELAEAEANYREALRAFRKCMGNSTINRGSWIK